MHPPIGGGVSTDFKSSNRIKISRLVQILLHFYCFGAPHPPGGEGWIDWVFGGLGMMWGPSRRRGDDEDDTGTTWGRRGRRGDHGDNMGWRPQRPQVIGTTWGPSGGYGDNVGMTGTTWGQWE